MYVHLSHHHPHLSHTHICRHISGVGLAPLGIECMGKGHVVTGLRACFPSTQGYSLSCLASPEGLLSCRTDKQKNIVNTSLALTHSKPIISLGKHRLGNRRHGSESHSTGLYPQYTCRLLGVISTASNTDRQLRK